MNDHENGAPGQPGRGLPGRRRTRAEERIEALDTSPTALLSEVADLKERLATAEQEAADNKAGWQRAMADMANFRRRTEQEREASLGLANEFLLLKLLTIVDDFDRALAQMPPELSRSTWIEGIVAIDRKLRALLDSEGLVPIEAEGAMFDPREHQAIAQEATDGVPDGTILAELQRGYRIRDRVLRPAMVTVATNDNVPDTTPNEQQDTRED
ncbi:MAG: nucleotide exchange factor GrpE [Candidatus Limnocylindrales bacterium]